MAIWSVVKDDNREKRQPGRYIRYAILTFTAVLAVSLGVTLIPKEAPAPPEPTFSERARTSALDEATALRTAGQQMADATSGAERQQFFRAVTLLTTQARALIFPLPDPSTTGSGAAPSKAAPSKAAPSATAPAPASAPELIAALSASGSRRITDAETADAGIARLLAAVGAAQLVQASTLASAFGLPAPTAPTIPAPLPTGAGNESCPTPTQATAESGGASLPAALSTAVKTEVEVVYGYQVALTRLDHDAAIPASELLARHGTLVNEAEAWSRQHCVAIPPREAGYGSGELFLSSPSNGLGSLESGTLPVYGDLIALSEGPTRVWAISGLLDATRRTARWGADPGPVPGVVLDTAQLPPLPASSSSPTASLGASPS